MPTKAAIMPRQLRMGTGSGNELFVTTENSASD